jgi:glutamine synthetase
MDRQEEFVLRTLEERDIRFVRLWFTDVLGFLKSVAVAPRNWKGVRRGDRLRRVGCRRLRAGLRGGHDRQAGSVHVPALAMAR